MPNQAKKKGSKKVEINWEEFDKLCYIQCTLREIASWFNCHHETIENKVKEEKGMKFAEYFELKRGVGKIALRRAQYRKAVHDGNVPLLIWLGKQYLNQSDKQEIVSEVNEKIDEEVYEFLRPKDKPEL
jgi:hypothetical protein